MKKINFPVGVILAAGQGKRLRNQVKALLKIGNKTFLERILENFQKIKVSPVILVLGYKADLVKAYLRKMKIQSGLKVVVNPEYQKEQLLSLILAIKNCPKNFSGIMFTPVDYPLVSLSTYRKLLTVWQKDPEKICLPSYQYRKGHPAIFPRWAAQRILKEKLTGGARDLLKKYPERINYVVVNDPEILSDFDTLKDLKYIHSL